MCPGKCSFHFITEPVKTRYAFLISLMCFDERTSNNCKKSSCISAKNVISPHKLFSIIHMEQFKTKLTIS